MKKVKVLLSTYNGERYITELLKSLSEQDGVDISVLIRDDGSKDNTLDMIKQFNEKIDIHLYKGNNIGYSDSFWYLITMATDADYYALCDQDDYWCRDKLLSAIKLIENSGIKGPILYTSNVISTDEKLKVINKDSFPVHKIVSFADSLKRSILPGCTFVFNDELLNYLKKYNGKRLIHDWSIYLIAKAVGNVLYDTEPHILYRIHGNNACGTEVGLYGLRKIVRRFIENKTPCARSQVANDILCFRDSMSLEDIKLAEHFSNYKTNLKSVFYLLKYKEYWDLRFLFMLALKRV